MTSLGGPGVACSAMRIRRLDAAELGPDERARTEAHLAACARCQGVRDELARERARLEEVLPFETFAAGVAERLARAERPSPRPARKTFRLVGLALAAGLTLTAAVPLVLRLSRPDETYRLKGGAALTVYVRDAGPAGEPRALSPGEPVPQGAALRLGLAPAGHGHVVVVLEDADGAAVLYAGPADAGVLPGAFEWTGAGAGRLVAVLDDVPVDAEALTRGLRQGGGHVPVPRPGAEVIVVPLTRGTP
jgi:hypothetical protein